MNYIFNGKYSWDGTKKDNREPIAWYPGVYDLKIFDRTDAGDGVKYLKPFACVYSRTGEGQSISAKPEKFAQQVCHDFSLELDKVLWVEDLHSAKDRYVIVMFHRSGKLGDTIFYKTAKRKPLPGEKKWLRQELLKLKKQ